ncbi:MAG: hypothetical protein Q4P22_06595 [Eubacteriales bacterium]|nr:hypothetical protein [Eubacteriales bacterium]
MFKRYLYKASVGVGKGISYVIGMIGMGIGVLAFIVLCFESWPYACKLSKFFMHYSPNNVILFLLIWAGIICVGYVVFWLVLGFFMLPTMGMLKFFEVTDSTVGAKLDEEAERRAQEKEFIYQTKVELEAEKRRKKWFEDNFGDGAYERWQEKKKQEYYNEQRKEREYYEKQNERSSGSSSNSNSSIGSGNNESNELQNAIVMFRLREGFTMDELKKARNELIKLYHSDVTHQSADDNKLKEINIKYDLLKKYAK